MMSIEGYLAPFQRPALSSTIRGLLPCLLLAAGCDFSVTNPGPVQDKNLDDPGAWEGIAGGAEWGALVGLNKYALRSSGVVREMQPAGGCGSAGVTHDEELGLVDRAGDGGAAYGWDAAHQGRWIGEQGAPRLEAVLGDQAATNLQLARIYLWTGYANRILGEHVCEAVFDGGAPEPYTRHFDRAIVQFTKAADIAARAGNTQIATAARAARASAYVSLGKWPEAVRDASTVPIDFAFKGKYYAGEAGFNLDWDIGKAANGTHRAISVWNTVNEKYYLETGDPRVAWGHDPSGPLTALGGSSRATYGAKVLFYWPMKYYIALNPPASRSKWNPNENAIMSGSVNLSTGREMQLILAEAKLVEGKWQEAVAILNSLRSGLKSDHTGAPLALWTVTNLNDAWAALKRERGIELWLEVRRIGDLRRWADTKTPGNLDPMEYTPPDIAAKFSVPRERSTCWMIPRSERETNPNVPMDHKFTR